MAYALVSLGAVNTGTNAASPTFGQATTAGNLLVAWVSSQSGSASVSGTGWVNAAGSGGRASVWYRPNCGAGESAPSVAGITSTSAQLAEFSGGHLTSPLDQTGTSTVITSPDTVTNGGSDGDVGELILGASTYVYSVAAAKTTSHAYNAGATATPGANNDATSTVAHYRFSFGITASLTTDALTDTFTTTSISTRNACIASLRLRPPSLFVVTPSVRW